MLAVSGVAVTPTGDLDFTNVHRDLAPDPGHGFNTYQVLTKLVLTVTAFTTSPKPAKAGRAFSVSMAVKENDTNGPVESGTVLCAATLGGQADRRELARRRQRDRDLRLQDPEDGEGQDHPRDDRRARPGRTGEPPLLGARLPSDFPTIRPPSVPRRLVPLRPSSPVAAAAPVTVSVPSKRSGSPVEVSRIFPLTATPFAIA